MTRPKKRRKPPRQPKSLQVAYWVHLRRLTRYAQRLVKERLVPLLPMLMERATPSAYQDALPPGKRAQHVLEAIRNQMAKATRQELVERAPRAIGKLVAERNAHILEGQGIEAKLNGTKKAIDAFTAENVALIRSVPVDYLQEVETAVHRAMTAGERHETLAKTIAERGGVMENRAKLIARDQVLKFNGSLNRVRQQAAGVDSYIWRTVEDERTRDAHADFDGNTYTWAEGAGDGSPEEGVHPGEAINCRCWSEPILPDLED